MVRGGIGKHSPQRACFWLSKEFLFYPEINKENFSKEPKRQIHILEQSLCVNNGEWTEEA